MKRMKPPLRSGFVGRPPAMSEKRSPINIFRFGASTLMNDVVRQLMRLEFKSSEALRGAVRYAASYDTTE